MKKTDYILDMGWRLVRRVWEDENGKWFYIFKGQRHEIQKNHFALKLQPSIKGTG